MNWFFIALVNPIVHAIVNHFDKYILSKWFKDAPVGVLIVFSSVFAILVLPILLVYDPYLFKAVSFFSSVVLVINGMLLAGAISLYLYALAAEEASYVVPFFQFIPIFGLVMGYFLLNEEMTGYQLWAILLIFIGSLLLSLEFQKNMMKIKHKMVLLMLGSSFLYALNSIIFKIFTPNHGFSVALFWNMLGMVLFGVGVLFLKKQYRKAFIHLLKTHHYKIIGLNVLNEVIGLIGEISLLFAILLAPVALVQSVGGLQPLFVFIIGVIITIFFPKFGKESLLFRHLTQKIISICIILGGLYLLEFK